MTNSDEASVCTIYGDQVTDGYIEDDVTVYVKKNKRKFIIQ